MGFIGDALKSGIMGVLLTLDSIIYGLISSAFRIFMAIAGARLLSSDAYTEIANKIYIIVGVLMLFVLAYSILKAIIDPDKGLKEALGPKLIKSVIVAVIGLAVAPVLFNLMYQAQGLVLEQDILSKLFFRSSSTEHVSVPNGGSVNPDEEIDNVGGSVTATSIWQAFFRPAEGYNAEDIKVSWADYLGATITTGLLCALAVAGTIAGAIATGGIGLLGVGASVAACSMAFSNGSAMANAGDEVNLAQAYGATASGDSFSIYCAFLTKYVDDGEIEYSWGVSTIAGAFTLYAFVSFSIDMGIRAAKLAYLQIIAPIPLVMQVLPGNDKRLGNYIKAVVSTFMEVFVRITVVYVVIYIICHLQEMFSSTTGLWGNDDLNAAEKLLAMAFLILGLIAFCRVAPGFLSEALGLSKGTMDGLGLKPSDFRKKLANGGVFGARAIGDGGARSAVRNWNKARKDGKTWSQAALSAAGGLGSGAVRAGMMGIGPEKIDTWRKAGDAAERAAQAAEARRDARAERIQQHHAAADEIERLNNEINTLEAERVAAVAAGDTALANQKRAEREAAERKLTDAMSRWEKTTAVGAVLDTADQRIHAWAVGTVDISQEEADIKFGSALDKLRDSARDTAYAKGSGAVKEAKKRYEELQSEVLSEYKTGWNESSFNQEVQRRVDAEKNNLATAQTDVAAATRARDTAQANLDALNASGTATAAQIAAAQTALNTAQANLNTKNADLATASAAFTAAQDRAIEDVKTIAMYTSTEMTQRRIDRQAEIKAAKDQMEAMADAWVADAFATNQADIMKAYSDFLSTNSEYISRNASRTIVYGEGAGDRVSVAQLVDTFADSSRTGVDTGKVAKESKFTVKTHYSGDIEFTPTFDSSGKLTGYSDSAGNTYTGKNAVDNALAAIAKLVSDDKAQCERNGVRPDAEVKTETAASTSAEAGKKIAKQMPYYAPYMDKVRRKRQADDAKRGNK